MNLTRAVLAFALAGGALSGVAPAAADTEVFGTYSFAAEDGENATWTLTPCADNAPGCVRVSETGNSKRVPWTGDAHWSVGSLILVVAQPDAVLCEDGTSAPGMNTYSWDGSTLSGSASLLTNGACGKSASLSIPFRLTRLGAAEAQGPAAATVPTAPGAPPPPIAEPAPAPSPPLAAESTAGPAGAAATPGPDPAAAPAA